MRIMLVEDDENVCLTMEFALKKVGHDIVGMANDGEAALNVYRDTNPELVIIDIILPKLHGIDVITKIKEMNTDAKILVTTGASHDSLIMKAMDSGAKSYLTKPFGMNDLITEIEKMK